MRLYIKQIPAQERPILAVDHTAWERLHSPTLQDRTYEHQPSAMASNKPICVGQGYSTIAWIPEQSGSWALPLRHERITSWENPISKAAWQIKQVCQHLPLRPIILLDSEYGNASLLNQTAEIEADCLMRIRSNRCLYSAPPLYAGKGRPRKHGQKFKLNDPSTWWEATETIEVDDSCVGAASSSAVARPTFLWQCVSCHAINFSRTYLTGTITLQASTFMVNLDRFG